MKNFKRITAGVGIAALLVLTGGAAAQAKTDIRDPGDGTGGCHKWVLVTYWGPWVCLY